MTQTLSDVGTEQAELLVQGVAVADVPPEGLLARHRLRAARHRDHRGINALRPLPYRVSLGGPQPAHHKVHRQSGKLTKRGHAKSVEGALRRRTQTRQCPQWQWRQE